MFLQLTLGIDIAEIDVRNRLQPGSDSGQVLIFGHKYKRLNKLK